MWEEPSLINILLSLPLSFTFFSPILFHTSLSPPLLHHPSPHPSLPVIPCSLCPIHAIMRRINDVSLAVALITVIAWRALLGEWRPDRFFLL